MSKAIAKEWQSLSFLTSDQAKYWPLSHS